MADPKKERKRPQRTIRSGGAWRKVAALALVAIALPAVGVLAWVLFSGSDEPEGPLRAVIVDQLSLTFPNQEFIDVAVTLLEDDGYLVDYIPGEDVTVDFYSKLPSHGYDVILIRSHSDRLEGEWQGEQINETILFTSEPWDDAKYRDDVANKRLTSARYFSGGERLFGISPDFVEDRMEGNFDGALIIAMGCDATGSSRTAESFINKGASAFIGWNELVSATHTDRATESLLQNILVEDLSAEEAVVKTMSEVGPDPTFDSELHIFSDDS